jgi:hypothetical protein
MTKQLMQTHKFTIVHDLLCPEILNYMLVFQHDEKNNKLADTDLSNIRVKWKSNISTTLNLFQASLTLKYTSPGNCVDLTHSSQRTDAYFLQSRRRTSERRQENSKVHLLRLFGSVLLNELKKNNVSEGSPSFPASLFRQRGTDNLPVP